MCYWPLLSPPKGQLSTAGHLDFGHFAMIINSAAGNISDNWPLLVFVLDCFLWLYSSKQTHLADKRTSCMVLLCLGRAFFRWKFNDATPWFKLPSLGSHCTKDRVMLPASDGPDSPPLMLSPLDLGSHKRLARRQCHPDLCLDIGLSCLKNAFPQST